MQTSKSGVSARSFTKNRSRCLKTRMPQAAPRKLSAPGISDCRNTPIPKTDFILYRVGSFVFLNKATKSTSCEMLFVFIKISRALQR